MTGAIILNRPISVYTLPTELLSNLSVRTIQAQPHGASSPPDQPRANAVTSVGGINCQTCPGAAFESIEEQRAHFKSDWHRYNVKAKLIGRTVTEEELGNLVEGESVGSQTKYENRPLRSSPFFGCLCSNSAC